MKFYTVGDELFQDKTKPNRFNLLNELNIFPTAGNPCNHCFYLNTLVEIIFFQFFYFIDLKISANDFFYYY